MSSMAKEDSLWDKENSIQLNVIENSAPSNP